MSKFAAKSNDHLTVKKSNNGNYIVQAHSTFIYLTPEDVPDMIQLLQEVSNDGEED